MAGPVLNARQKLINFSRRRKRLLTSIAVALVAYALLGFFVAPWAVKKVAINAVDQALGAELRLEKVAINPFVFSLRIDGLELDMANGEPLARVEQIFTNFQLSSLVRWAWSFAEIRFDAPEFFLIRDESGTLNLADLASNEAAPEPPADPASEATLPRLFIGEFSINDARIDWLDQVPAEAVETVFGPVSVKIAELNTLPERPGEQEVVITTETLGTLSWSGSLQLSPFASAGRAAVMGSHFPLLSAYIRHETGLDITDGEANIELDYSVLTATDGQLQGSIDNLEISFTDLRVNTFHAEPDDKRQPREFLHVPRIALEGGTLRWPERELAAADYEIDDAALDLVRLDDGQFDFAMRAPQDAPTADELAEPASADNSPWRVALDRFAISNLDVALSDQSVEPTANTGLNAIALEVLSISNDDGASFPTTLSMDGQQGGTIRLNGSVVALPQPEVEFDLAVEDLSLAAGHSYIQPLADVNLDSGTLSDNGKLRHDATDPLLFTSDIEIDNFLITETDEGTRLGSWNRLFAEGVELSIANKSLEISEVRFDNPYADVLVAADGSVNLGRIAKVEGDGEDTETVTAPEQAADANDSPPEMNVTIGRVIINDGAADFVDESLPLRFGAKIEALNGSLSTISTGSVEPSNVQLEGKVDEYGLVRVSGSVTPLDVSRNTDLHVIFENVEMPKFSAYTIPFAGREIASGRLDLDLGYEVADRKLAGENRIVLREFELGEEIDHPDAMSLPLGLAVALLKDPSGKIDIDLPVRGDLDDPEFGYGRVLSKALVNLIVKIVASPFALLGNLVGVEPDELEYINFPAGRADLTPPEVERVQKIAEALQLRPELVLEISGVIDREADLLALKSARIDAEVESRIESASGEDDESYTAQRAQVIESMYRESASAGKAELDIVRAEYTSVEIDAVTGKESERFDQLAYTEDLRRRLIANESIAETELVALARQRADNTSESLLAANPELDNRVHIIDLREEDSRTSDDSVRMKVSLTTRSAEGSQ